MLLGRSTPGVRSSRWLVGARAAGAPRRLIGASSGSGRSATAANGERREDGIGGRGRGHGPREREVGRGSSESGSVSRALGGGGGDDDIVGVAAVEEPAFPQRVGGAGKGEGNQRAQREDQQ